MRLISDDALATMLIWQESRGEPYLGKLGVAEVLRNRTQQKYMSDGTVTGTALFKNQFSGMNAGDPNRIPSFRLDDIMPTVQECQRAWKEACEGSNVVLGAVHYLNVKLTKILRGGTLPLWAENPGYPGEVNPMLVLKVIGNHTFLRKL